MKVGCRWYMMGILVLLPLLVYLNCLHNDFVYDDLHLVSHNQGIKGIQKVPSIFSLKKLGSYRPVRMASYALDYSLNQQLWRHLEGMSGKDEGYEWGLNPFGYHFSNLLYHIITVLLVFLVINTLTGDHRVAFLVSVLFSIHPVHTESVAYISGRRDILSTLFYLIGFYSFMRWRTSLKWRYSVMCGVSYLLALGSKEMAVTLPLLCFCFDVVRYLQVESGEKGSSTLKRVLRVLKKVVVSHKYFYLMFFVAAAFATYYKVWIKSPSVRHSFYGEHIGLHVLTMAKVMVHYLTLMLFPINLVADYSYRGFPLASSLFEPSALMALLILVFIFYFFWRLLNSSPLLSFGIMWWWVTLLPVCQIFPHHELMAEHYLYLPSIGFLLVMALLVVEGIERGRWKQFVYSSLCIVIVLFSVRAVYRNGEWKDATTLWEETVKIVPHCVRAQNNLGVCYYTQGRYQEAKEKHQLALRVSPDHVDSYNNLGNACLALRLDKEAEEYYTRALELDPSYEKAHSNLGMVCIKKGRYQEALAHLTEATRLNPRFAYPYYGKGLLMLLLKNISKDSDSIQLNDAFKGSYGIFLKDVLKNPDAILWWALDQFKKAISYNPGFAEAYSNLASVYILRGQYEEAERALLTAIRLKPGLVEAHKNLIELYEIVGKKDKAAEARVNMLALAPESGENFYRMGVLYRSQGDYARALTAFRKALVLQYESAEIHNELGIVHRAQGDYKSAVSEYRKALSLLPEYAEAHYNLALTYQSMGIVDEALLHYQRALALKPQFPQALINMGSLYARKKDYEKAITLFKKVVELEPSSALAHNNLGNVYREKGNYREAIKEYETAAGVDATYSDPDFNLGQLYLKDLKETARALYHYKRSMAITPHHPRVAALKKEVENLEKVVGTTSVSSE